jgi:hypothetical protein
MNADATDVLSTCLKYGGRISQANITLALLISVLTVATSSRSEKVTVGQQIRFEIQLPTGSWMPFYGEVVNHHPNLGFGVRFIGLTEQDKRVLAQTL